MRQLVVFDETGQVLELRDHPTIETKKNLAKKGIGFIEIDGPNEINEIYVTVAKKKPLPAQVDRTEILANDIDMAVITGVPAGCKIIVTDGIDGSEYDTNGEPIQFHTPTPGEYWFRIVGAPYLPFEFKVIAL